MSWGGVPNSCKSDNVSRPSNTVTVAPSNNVSGLIRSAVDAVRCAVEVQTGLGERNAGVPKDRRIEYRVSIHVGDVG